MRLCTRDAHHEASQETPDLPTPPEAIWGPVSVAINTVRTSSAWQLQSKTHRTNAFRHEQLNVKVSLARVPGLGNGRFLFPASFVGNRRMHLSAVLFCTCVYLSLIPILEV